MNFQSNKLIFKKINAKLILIQKVCEVGVYLPETSNIIDFVKQGKETILVEPEPRSIEAIESYFEGYNNVTLIPAAIYKHTGTITLSKAEASTFVSDLPTSPALKNDSYQIKIEFFRTQGMYLCSGRYAEVLMLLFGRPKGNIFTGQCQRIPAMVIWRDFGASCSYRA